MGDGLIAQLYIGCWTGLWWVSAYPEDGFQGHKKARIYIEMHFIVSSTASSRLDRPTARLGIPRGSYTMIGGGHICHGRSTFPSYFTIWNFDRWGIYYYIISVF